MRSPAFEASLFRPVLIGLCTSLFLAASGSARAGEPGEDRDADPVEEPASVRDDETGTGSDPAHAAADSDPAATPDRDPATAVAVDTLRAVTVEADRDTRLAEMRRLTIFSSYLDVDRSTEGMTSVADVLEEAAGVRVRRMGGLGSFSTASIRGSTAGQVEVYLDGIPLNSSQFGATNLADLPVDNLEHIEVYRSAAPAEYGSAGIGGVINLVTRSPESPRRLLSLTRGSYDTWKADALFSEPLGPIRQIVSAHHLQSRGDYLYLNRYGTTKLNTEDDRVVRRENNQFKQTDVLLRTLWNPGAPGNSWDLELAVNPYWKENGLPGVENIPFQQAHVRNFRNLVRVEVETPRFLGRSMELRARGFHQLREDEFHNPKQEKNLPRWDTKNESRSYGANFLATWNWFWGRQRIQWMGELRRESFTPVDMNPRIGEGFTRRRDALAFVAEDRFTLWPERLTVLAAYRYESMRDNFFGPVPFGRPPEPLDGEHELGFGSPRLGAQIGLPGPLTLKVNRTEYARFPTMLELFGADGFIQGNPELVPERGTTFDCGVVLEVPGSRALTGQAEVTYFRSERESLIVFLPNSQRTVKAFNFESAKVEGVEAGTRWRWRDRIALGATYTYQKAVNTSPTPIYEGKWLPYQAPHDLFVRGEIDLGMLSLRYEFEYLGAAFRDRANLPENQVDARRLHDVAATVRLFGSAIAVTGEVQNLSDVQGMDVEGYPLPGRMVFVTLELDSAPPGRAGSLGEQ